MRKHFTINWRSITHFVLDSAKILGHLLLFVFVYIGELFKANYEIAKRSLSFRVKINPGIVKIQTDLKSDLGLAMLSNSITLSPGTIALDIVEEEEKCFLYVHWIDVSSRNVKEASAKIKGVFEHFIRRVFI